MKIMKQKMKMEEEKIWEPSQIWNRKNEELHANVQRLEQTSQRNAPTIKVHFWGTCPEQVKEEKGNSYVYSVCVDFHVVF